MNLRSAILRGLLLLLGLSAPASADPVDYSFVTRTEPRPIKIHVLKIDVKSPTIEVEALITRDPDGTGPAEAQLEKPLSLAQRNKSIAAVNANAFGFVPPPAKGERPPWKLGSPVDIVGWAKNGARQASQPLEPFWNLWIEDSGRVRINGLKSSVPARLAVAGFGGLLRAGEIIDRDRDTLHPRTAVGTEANGRWLWLVVVDGRQNGYSEGMSTFELATLMRELGCADAMNLDGGGSSIMLLQTKDQPLHIVNRPSDWGTRPVPVMIAVKSRERSSAP